MLLSIHGGQGAVGLTEVSQPMILALLVWLDACTACTCTADLLLLLLLSDRIPAIK